MKMQKNDDKGYQLMSRKPDISYPCIWEYRVIGTDERAMRAVIAEACAPQRPDITVSNRSATGKYCSLNARLTVASEELRNRIFSRIQQCPDVKMVI
jgi:putative lipoic acid-binding regulatory protein